MSFGNAANNLHLIDRAPNAIQGIYTYIGAGVSANGFDCPHNASYLRAEFEPYLARGVSVTPALALANDSVISGSAASSVDAVAAFAKAINASGFMLDFEPSTSSTAWVAAYAAYVAKFTAAMHAVGLRAEMCVSSWGILDSYGVYAQTGVDRMMSMAGTYFGSNVTKNLANVDTELAQGVSKDQLAAGIGTQIDASIDPSCPSVAPMGCKLPGGQCYNWTESRLESFIDGLTQRGVVHIDFWRADIDAEGDCTAAWYFAAAEKFIAGGSTSAAVADAETGVPLRNTISRSHHLFNSNATSFPYVARPRVGPPRTNEADDTRAADHRTPITTTSARRCFAGASSARRHAPPQASPRRWTMRRCRASQRSARSRGGGRASSRRAPRSARTERA